MPKAFGSTRKAAPATDTRFAYGHRSARQMRQPTASATKTKQRYKKRSNCKHKKSGCVCFIVARLRAFPCGIGTSGTTRACAQPTDPTAKLRIYARTRKIHRNKKQKHFSASNYPPDKTRGKETRLPDHHNKQGNFSPSSPPLRSSPRDPIRSHPIAVRTHARVRVRAFSRFAIITFTVHLLPLFHSECDD